MIVIVALVFSFIITTNAIEFNSPPLGGKIIGGEKVKHGDMTYLVALEMDRNEHFCVGCLISLQHVLTATHCIHPQTIWRMSKKLHHEAFAVVGAANILKGGRRYKIIHIDFEQFRNHDGTFAGIGIATLETKIDVPNLVQVIPLYKYKPSHEVHGLVAGWGSEHVYESYQDNHPMSANLKVIRVTTTNISVCTKKYFGLRTYPTSICALSDFARESVSNGDSGAPLIYNEQVIGVLHGGNMRYTPDPLIFIETFSFLKEIQAVLDRPIDNNDC